MDTVSVASTSFGVATSQGIGAGDVTAINLVTTPTPPTPNSVGAGPPNIVVVQGNVVQGSGSGDSASVTNSTLPGSISTTQTDVAGNALGDSATISGDKVGFTVTIGGTILPAYPGSLTISQGYANGDQATVSNSTAVGDVTITQGDGNGDWAQVVGITAGTTIPASPYVIPFDGTVTITQGSAPGDVAYLDGDAINNVSITQGDNVQAPNGTTVVSDVAEINDTSVTSNVSINQGTGASTAINAGNYVAAIGYDYLGYMKGTPASSSVTVGGDTKIDQNYANNQVYLGDADSSFTTVYLDVFTGFGGGAFVMARNTTVDFGSLFGIYTIDGGGSGNTYVDGSGNSGVTVDPANFNFSTLLTPVLTWANPADITYGTALGATQLDATASVPGSFIYTPAAGTVLSAGANETLSVTFTPTDTTDYGPVTATAMINVNRAALLITANSATRVYGQQNPAFTVTYAGLTNGDSPSSLGGSLHFSTAATASSPVNTYSVVPGGLTSANYAITFAGAKLVVAPASLTITANNQSRVFGQPNPPLTVYYQGFVNGDTPASLTAPVVLSTPAVLASFAGSYPIFVGGAASPNYAIRLVSGTLAVMPPTDPVVLGHIAFVTSLDRDLLLRSPGPADLFSWLQQLNTGRSALHVASAINQLPERRAVLRSHHGVGISFAVALERAVKAQQHAIQNARRALK